MFEGVRSDEFHRRRTQREADEYEVGPSAEKEARASRDALGRERKACSQEGEQDPVSEWFESEHSFGEFRGRGEELIETIVDKLET